MNLNEFVINPGRGRGKKNCKNKGFVINKLSPSNNHVPSSKKTSTPSSDLNWGKSHISVPITPSTAQKSVSSSRISSEEDSRVIVALTEGRGEARCEVGIAVISASKPLLILCQISDTQSYINTLTKINIFNPHEILVPMTFIENFSGNRLIDKVKEQFPNIKYTGIARSMYSKITGKELLADLCIPSLNAILLVLQHRYYALAAAAALISYVQDSLFIYYSAGSIKIDYQESEGYAIIDVSTADRLELVASTRPAQGNKYSSLFGVLNNCQTKIGTRTLRSFILQPPCDVNYIEERLNCVTELMKRPEALLSIQALLQKVPNIDLLLSIGTIIPDDPQRCSNRQLNYILLLNSLLDLITPLKDIVSKLNRPFYAQLKATLESEDFTFIRDIVRNTIQENAHPAKGQAAVLQRCFAIKPAINGLLDLVRKTYSERIDDMREYVKGLAEKHDLPLTLGNNQSKGHHIVLNLNQQQKRYMKKSDLPTEFIHVNRLMGSFTMKTAELINLSTRLDDIMRDILTISNVMVHSIIVEIKKYVSLFYRLCEEIAYLDVLQSLAEASMRTGSVRPKFGDFTELTFAHHPMLDFLLSTRPVSNPISCSNEFNVHIITGPNGSGKSIFIRQVLLLQVMAQVGCYVPAQTACFRPADRMFARIYLEDNMEYGASSFMLEMKEIKYIMTTMTENSLIVIDELCRSTSLEEGTALAITILERLAQSSAFIYITTHYILLTKLYEMYLNVKVWQLETIPSGDDPKTFKLDFRHSLIPGITSVKHYGVYIVRNIWPDSILKDVDEMLQKITKINENAKITPLDDKVRLKYNLDAHIRKLKAQKKLTIAEINKLLNQYQNDLEKLGYSINSANAAVNKVTTNIPQIYHSIFNNSQSSELYNVNENLVTDQRINQFFTPEPSMCSQTVVEIETQMAEEKMREIFTPNSLQQFSSPANSQCVYQRENMYPFSENSNNYMGIANFIDEHPQNINKLIPEVNLIYDDTSNCSQNNYNVVQNDFGLFGSELIQPTNREFPPEDISKENPSSVDLSEDMNQYRFSEPLCNQFSKTSTPVVQIYSQRPNFLDTSSKLHFSNEKIIDIEEELEVCSKAFEDDDFEASILSANNILMGVENEQGFKKTLHQNIMPKVIIKEGLNNKSMSFGEEDKISDAQQNIMPQNKVNVVSNVLVSTKNECQATKERTVEDNERASNEGAKEKHNQKQVLGLKSYQSFKSIENDVDFETWSKLYDEPLKEKICDRNAKSLNDTIDNIKENYTQDEQYENCTSDDVGFSKELEEVASTNPANSNNDLNTTCKLPVEGYQPQGMNEDIGKAAGETKPEENSGSQINDDKTHVTSISNASKLRNLEQVTSDSSPLESSNKKTSTSISSVSRKRNLEQVTTDTSSRSEKSEKNSRPTDQSETSSGIGESDGCRGKRKKKFSHPRKSKTGEGRSIAIQANSKQKAPPNRKKFVPPRKLSAREIREEFKEQDRKILETSPSSSNYSKYLEQLIKRPSVKQIQNTTHLALITKTSDGFEVIPAQPPAKRKTKQPSLKRHFSNETFNMSIFSDKHAQTFEDYLNSNRTKATSFNFQKSEGTKFEFQPTAQSVGDYTKKSVTMRLVRTESDIFKSQSKKNENQQVSKVTPSQMSHVGVCLTQQSVQTLTPDGFYKQNKEDVTRIVNKYILAGASQPSRFNTIGNIGNMGIFDDRDISASDLDL